VLAKPFRMSSLIMAARVVLDQPPPVLPDDLKPGDLEPETAEPRRLAAGR
jgi:hypothetical protein